MDRFVLGFAYTLDGRVLLIRKNRPQWQAGLLNGIGGHVEEGENIYDAMDREAKEETGLELNWDYVGQMVGVNNDSNSFTCDIFFARSEDVIDFKQMEDQPLALYGFHDLLGVDCINNVPYIVLIGLSNDNFKFIRIEY